MELTVWIEPTPGGVFLASALGLPLTAEGKTQEEAMRNLRQVVEAKLRAGATITTMRVGTNKSRVLEMVGTLNLEDPLVKEWIDIMAERRREEDTMQEAS